MSKGQLNQFPHSIGLAPEQAQGVRALGPLLLSFPGIAGAGTQTYADDFNMEEIDGTINTIQSLWFDSSDMVFSAVLSIRETGQNVILPPNYQGYVPIFANAQMTYTVTTAGASASTYQQLSMTFFNTPCSPGIWKAPSQSFSNVVAASNAGNAAISLQANGGVAIRPGSQIYVDGFNITGTGATAGGAVTALLSGIFGEVAGIIGNQPFLVPVPTLPNNLNFERVFNPPLLCGLITKSGLGIAGGAPILTVPAMGVGQTAVGAELYYHLS